MIRHWKYKNREEVFPRNSIEVRIEVKMVWEAKPSIKQTLLCVTSGAKNSLMSENNIWADKEILFKGNNGNNNNKQQQQQQYIA